LELPPFARVGEGHRDASKVVGVFFFFITPKPRVE